MSRPYKIHTLESLRCRCVEEGSCWIWQGATGARGKPQMRSHGKVVHPRRLARTLADGQSFGPNVEVVARCGNVLCISPECSVKTTAKGRARMASERGSFRNPAKNRRGALTLRARSWITEAMVEQIKSAENAAMASAMTGVSRSHCKAIRSGAARKDYGNPFAGLGAANDGNSRRTA